jgi:hypothetical protein
MPIKIAGAMLTRLQIGLSEPATMVIVSQKDTTEAVALFRRSRKTNFRYSEGNLRLLPSRRAVSKSRTTVRIVQLPKSWLQEQAATCDGRQYRVVPLGISQKSH